MTADDDAEVDDRELQEDGDPLGADTIEYDGPTKLERIARESAFALQDTRPWLHRRVEKIRFVESQNMIRREVSIDFTIPPDLPKFEDVGDERAIYFVPIALLAKWPPVMAFSFKDGDGHVVPLLTSTKNGRVDAEALIGLAPDGELRTCAEPSLRTIGTGDPQEAQQAFDLVVQLLLQRRDSLHPNELEKWARALYVATNIVGNSLVWARVVARPSDRRIVKFGFEHPFEADMVLRRRLLSAFSWGAVRAHFELPNLGERGSYHLQVTPPPEMHVRRATLRVSKVPPVPDSGQQRTGGERIWRVVAKPIKTTFRGFRSKWRVLFPKAIQSHRTKPPPGTPYERNVGDRAHLYIEATHNQFGLARIDFMVSRVGLIRGALVTGFAVAVLMTVLATRSGTFAAQAGATVTVLLVVPALLGFLIVRPGEHPVTTKNLIGVRLLALLSGAIPVAAAVVLLAVPQVTTDPRTHQTVTSYPNLATDWWILAGVAWYLALLVLLSWLLPSAWEGPATPD